MLFCTDCQLPARLDDAVKVFRDGTCICLLCHRPQESIQRAWSGAMRRDLAAALAGLSGP